MNHAGGLKKNLIVVLNDNKMSICPRVGGLAEYLDRLRMNPLYTGLKAEVQKLLNHVPVSATRWSGSSTRSKDAIKAGLLGGMFFEELGFRYIGPVDGHNIGQLQKYLAMVRQVEGPVLLHVVTEKGHGFQPAAEDPTSFHTPGPFAAEQRLACAVKKSGAPVLHRRWPATAMLAADAGRSARGGHHRRHVPGQHAGADPRRSFPIASSTWAFASRTPWPSPPAWPRPACGRSSTSTARSCSGATTRSSRKSSLQNLPVTLLLGPRRPGRARTARRITASSTSATCGRCPTWPCMAPGDAAGPGADDRLVAAATTVRRRSAIPRPRPKRFAASRRRSNWARPKCSTGDTTACSIACGTLLRRASRPPTAWPRKDSTWASSTPASSSRWTRDTILRAVRECPWVVTVEEGALMGGFGSAVLEAACDAGLGRRPHPPPRHPRSVHRARRPRRTAGRPGAGRPGHRADMP